MQWVTTLKLIISILPLIIEAIKAIEQAIPGQGKGEAKLAAVRGLIEAVYTASTEALPKFETLWPVLLKVIGSLVNSFNSSGEFVKTG